MMAKATQMENRDSDVVAAPASRRVPMDAPWSWLAAGWNDMWRVPSISLTYGVAVALAAVLITWGLVQTNALSLFMALAGAFLLIGPWAAAGLYHASQRLQAGQSVTLSETIFAGFTAPGQMLFFGAILLFVCLVWLQVAFLLLMMFMGSSGLPPPSQFMHMLLFTPNGLGLLIVGTIVGGILASFVFAISAFAVPMMIEYRVDAVSAARASIGAIVKNPKPCALWAVLIAGIMAAGFVTLFAGLVFAFPLIGHATWHAYSDVFHDRRS